MMTITQELTALEGLTRRSRQTPAAFRQPRALGPLALLDLLQSYVSETAELLPVAQPDLAERQYELLELTDELEIWAIHWPQGQGLELHDHGGSVGALWVVEGSLEEHYVRTERTLGKRTIVSGGGAAFGPHYVHDVVNALAAPATSVHAYSPPMESMTFYRQERHGLVVDRAEYRADPSWAP
jgi:predicted metal-dependent enzyme (double-stranded beta helix superfamily)